ncbi:hypothetical protein FHG66_11325 [Rubellimicrobium rubrum]|uniref:ADP-ribosylglycohydrolase family protein n=1 Tax=Rubellimicrobium rubrum TaxID=2585369 RepID=A0A5C4MTE1_9RHOB|nr:inositol monophosphatase family protein [Rubellimicrobium rubrum]TNC49317.1 hypothetical protein FHG66_11325 [Rubellimicrobium rubrum]
MKITPTINPAAASLLDDTRAAVLGAGAMIRAELHRPGGPRQGAGYDKAPIDTEVEQFLQEKLQALHPCNWQGEELPRHRGHHSDTWVVDPQDGTRAFLKGLRGSAISVALVRNGRPVLAVVYAPTAPDDAGDLFTWADGVAPTRNGVALQPLGTLAGRIERRQVPYDASVVIGMNETAGDYARVNHTALSPAGVLAMPSIAYRLALAAAGEVDAAVSLTGGLESYDVAAGHALVEAAGGEVLQLNGRPLVHGPASSFMGCVGGRAGLVGEVIRRVTSIPGSTRVPRHPAKPRRRIVSASVLSRAQGCLLGQFAGDALGAQVEFLSPADIRRKHPQGVTEMRPGGTWGLLAGQITDDSEMALALARGLLEEGGFNAKAVGQAYLAWGASDPFDMGGTTRAGLSALAGRGVPSTLSQANGALMRVSPIGVACAGDPARAAAWARADAALTHPHPVCVAASSAFAAAIAAGVAGADPATMWAVAHAQAGEGAGADEVRSCLVEAREAGPQDATRKAGWVLIALSNAAHRLWTGQGLEAALVETVGMGGDTDTNAAICGALLGATQGREAVPMTWRRQVLGCRAVKGVGVRQPRPAVYWTDDAVDLAEGLTALAMRAA